MKAQKMIIEPFQDMIINRCNIIKMINQHIKVEFEGIISDKEIQMISTFSGETQIVICVFDEEDTRKIVFRGYLEYISINSQGGIHKIFVKGKSATCLLDEKEKVRTFQNQKQTYKDIINAICMKNKKTSVIYMEGKSQKAGELIVQYHETDWEFFKRMASHLNTALVPDCSNESICFYFGIPEKMQLKELDGIECTECFCNGGSEYIVKSREVHELCEVVSFGDKNLLIYKIESYFEKEEFVHDYYLCSKGRLKVRRCENKKIMGASIMGTVLSVKDDLVQVNMFCEEELSNENKKWFPYASVYSSPDGTGWYCMPEKGDKVRICFPDFEEDHAFVSSAYHCSQDNSLRDDPDKKFLRTIHNKEVRFTPNNILLTNHQGISVELDDDKGISIKSNKSILIESETDIKLKSQEQVRIEANEGVLLIQDGNSIVLRNGIRQNGISVRYK